MKQQTEMRTKGVEMSEIMPPHAANFSGKVHGGYLMLLLDRVAYACAVRYSGHYAVTLSVDHILFKEPIYVGELVTFLANVNYVGRTSMEVGIRVMAEDLREGKPRHTNTCYFTMVAVDEEGKPVQLEPLVLETEVEKYRFKEAEMRKLHRLSVQSEHKAHHQVLAAAHQLPED